MPQGRYFFNIIPIFEKYLPVGAPVLLKVALFTDTETLTHLAKKYKLTNTPLIITNIRHTESLQEIICLKILFNLQAPEF